MYRKDKKLEKLKFEKEKFKKRRKILKNSWFEWLINFIPEQKKLHAISMIRFKAFIIQKLSKLFVVGEQT